jgi:hypothetical protein
LTLYGLQFTTGIMATISTLSTAQLKQIVSIKEQIEALTAELNSIAGPEPKAPEPVIATTPKKRGMSAAGRAAISAAVKARWAKLKGEAVVAKPAKLEAKPKKDKRSSQATRAKMAAAAKARWAKAKAEGKKGL